MTNNIGAAVRGARLILCPAPDDGAPDIARMLAPQVSNGPVVYLAARHFRFRCRPHVMPATVPRPPSPRPGTLPWLTRRHAPFETAITAWAKRPPAGVFPPIRKDHALSVLRSEGFSNVIEDCGDALSRGPVFRVPIIHPPLNLLLPASAFPSLGHP